MSREPVFDKPDNAMYEDALERGHLLPNMCGTGRAPYALLVRSRSSATQAVAEAEADISNDQVVPPQGNRSAFSYLLPFRTSPHQRAFEDLSPHRIPVYCLSELFSIPSPTPSTAPKIKRTSEYSDSEGRIAGKSGNKASNATLPSVPNSPRLLRDRKGNRIPINYSDLAITHPEIYHREVSDTQRMLERCQAIISNLLSSSNSTSEAKDDIVENTRVCSIPAGKQELLPLLKALWRCRLWFGEGWSGEGLGIREATGRGKG